MNPGFILFFIGGGFVLGILGYTYHQGKESCVSHYEHMIAQAKIKAQASALKDSKQAQEVAEQLAKEAQNEQSKSDAKADALKKKIDTIIASQPKCIDADFLRELGRIN